MKKRLNEWAKKKGADSLIGSLVYTLTRRNEAKEDDINKTVDENFKLRHSLITDEDLTMGQYQEKHKVVNLRFGYMFVKPVLWVGEKILGKFLIRRIRNAPHNVNIILFNEVFEKSLMDWAWNFQSDDNKRKQIRKEGLKEPKYGSHELLRTMKRFLLTLIYADTAYREFFNILMFNITVSMNKTHAQHTKHLLYKGRYINDVTFFAIKGIVEGNLIIKDPEGNFLAVNKEACQKAKKNKEGGFDFNEKGDHLVANKNNSAVLEQLPKNELYIEEEMKLGDDKDERI